MLGFTMGWYPPPVLLDDTETDPVAEIEPSWMPDQLADVDVKYPKLYGPVVLAVAD